MNLETYQACMNKGSMSWNDLAKSLKMGENAGERLRSQYKRMKAKLKTKQIQQPVIVPVPVRISLPKVVIFDIETSPLVAYVWGLWNQNIQPERLIHDWCIISWSAKLLYSNETMSDVLTPSEAVNRDDERIVKSLWKVLNEADIIIAHNGKSFDVPRSNSRFLYYHLSPPNYSKVIDTLEIAKKNFGFTSNKLDYICGYLNLEHKKDTDFSLWEKCMKGDGEALSRMVAYNEQDVNILEDMYVAVRGWIRPHPNVALWGDMEDAVCPNCGSEDIHENGFYYTQVNKFTSYRCNDCGALMRGRKTVLSKEERNFVLMS